MCNRTDCAGVFMGELACRVCEEGEMGKIESQISFYAAHLGYMTPEEIEKMSVTPQTREQHYLYAAAHCMVSERFEKSDLVNMVYAILQRECEANNIAIMANNTDKLKNGIDWLISKIDGKPCDFGACPFGNKIDDSETCVCRPNAWEIAMREAIQ